MELGKNTKSIVMIVIVVVVVLLLVIFIQQHIFKQKSLTSGVLDATKQYSISSDKLSASSNGNLNYTYSMWIYVSDWSYNLGVDKVVLSRGEKSSSSENIFYPQIYLGKTENTLTIRQSMQTSQTDYVTNNCTIENVPLQKWTCIIVSMNDRDMDVYLNGKLVRTCVLPYPPYCPGGDDVKLSPKGIGFQGSISNVSYWPNAISPQQAWNIYKYGPGGTSMTDIFQKFQLKFVFLENGQEEGSFTI